MHVYLEGTGAGDAVAAFAQFSRAAAARKLRVMVDDPVELENGSGRFLVDVGHTDTRDDAIAVVRALLDQIPGGGAAFAFDYSASAGSAGVSQPPLQH
jgi:hypothetical protein